MNDDLWVAVTWSLEDKVLDWAVEQAELAANRLPDHGQRNKEDGFHPSTDWAQGGPIIERERICLEFLPNEDDPESQLWIATHVRGSSVTEQHGHTALTAAMRCYLMAEIGEYIPIPDEIRKELHT